MKTAIIVILIIAVVILFLLLSDIAVKIFYDKSGKIVIKFLFFKYKISTENKKNKDKSKNNKKRISDNNKKSDSQIKKTIEKQGVLNGATEIIRTIEGIFRHINALVKKCRVIKFNLFVSISEGDAAKTAITYGVFCSAAYPIIGLINNWFQIKNQNVEFVADYEKSGYEIRFDSVIKLKAVFLIRGAVGLLKEYLKIKK